MALCRAAAEGVCQVLAAGWRCGHRSAVQATFAPLADLAPPAGDAAGEHELQARAMGSKGIMLNISWFPMGLGPGCCHGEAAARHCWKGMPQARQSCRHAPCAFAPLWKCMLTMITSYMQFPVATLQFFEAQVYLCLPSLAKRAMRAKPVWSVSVIACLSAPCEPKQVDVSTPSLLETRAMRAKQVDLCLPSRLEARHASQNRGSC